MISQTQINTYINCSKKYYWKYIKQEPPSNKIKLDGLIIGKVLHQIIEYYITYKSNPYEVFKLIFFQNIPQECFDTEKELNGEDIINFMIKHLLPDYNHFINKRTEQLKIKINEYPALFDICVALWQELKLFVDDLLKEYINIMPEIEIFYNDIHGFVDIMAVDKKMDDVIIDFKFKRQEKETKKAIQDLLYSWIIWKNKNVIPVFEYINVIYDLKGRSGVKINRIKMQASLDDMALIEEYIYNFKKGIKYQIFLRNMDSFLCSPDYCEYYNICIKGGINEGKEKI